MSPGSAPPDPRGLWLTGRQDSHHATDRSLAAPTGALTLGFDAGRFPPTRQPATRRPGAYRDRTSTGRRMRAYVRIRSSQRNDLRFVVGSAGGCPALGAKASGTGRLPPPHRTVREVLPHTAHRHPSPGRMRGSAADGPDVEPSARRALGRQVELDLEFSDAVFGVVGRMLSVIYFPFWVVELKQGDKNCLAILDAVSQAVITLDATPRLYDTLDQEISADPQVIGFRPLTCSNCGWDLPVRPDNVIFFCSSCEKSWQILGNCLYEVSYRIAKTANAENHKQLKYLPFWVLETKTDENGPAKLFLPAFRYRQLKFLSDLAIRISRQQPSYTVLTEKLPEVEGCYYDQEDAVMLAQFSQVGMAPRPLEKIKALQEDNFSMTDATLTWFPYEINGIYLIDPFTGHRLMRNLLL